MPSPKKAATTLERWSQKPAFKKALKKDYQDFLLSELICALMAEEKKSIRALAEELNLSKTVIANLRSGAQSDMKLSNFVKLTQAYGFKLVLEKEGARVVL